MQLFAKGMLPGSAVAVSIIVPMLRQRERPSDIAVDLLPRFSSIFAEQDFRLAFDGLERAPSQPPAACTSCAGIESLDSNPSLSDVVPLRRLKARPRHPLASVEICEVKDKK